MRYKILDREVSYDESRMAENADVLTTYCVQEVIENKRMHGKDAIGWEDGRDIADALLLNRCSPVCIPVTVYENVVENLDAWLADNRQYKR